MTASLNTSLVGFCRIPIVKEHQRTMIAGNIETNHHVVCKIISFGIIWIPQFWKIIMYLRCFNHHVLHIHIVTKPPFAPHRWSSNCRHRPGGQIPGKCCIVGSQSGPFFELFRSLFCWDRFQRKNWGPPIQSQFFWGAV